MEIETMVNTSTVNGLPKGWRWEPLSEVADNLDNKRKPINAAEREARKGNVPYYGATGQVGWIDEHLIDEEVVLVGEDGAPFLDPSRSKAYMIRGKSWVNNHAHILRARDGMPNAYLMHYLNILDYSPYVTGTTRLKLTKGAMNKIPVPLAPLPEQHRIVAAIETQLGRLDAAVANLHAAKAKLKRYKQAVLKAAYSEGEPTRLEELCEFITKGTTPTKAMMNGQGIVPFIKVYNLTRDGTLDFTIDPTFVTGEVHKGFLARSICYPGDVLMNIVGPPLGKVSLVPGDYPEWNINQAIARYRCKPGLRARYLMYYLLCETTAQELMATTKATAGQFNLTLENCRDLTVPMVSTKKQDALIARLDDKLGTIDETESTLDTQLVQAGRLRQAVLKRAFEGRLV